MAQPTLLSQVFLPPAVWEGIYQSLCGREGAPVTPSFGFSVVLIATGLFILGAIALARWSAQHQELEARVQQHTATLQESEARFRQLTEAIQEVFWLFDPIHHQNLYVSPAYEQLWGQPLDKVYDHGWSWIDAIHPDDRDWVLALFANSKSWEHEVEYRILHSDGSVRWVRDRSFPLRNEQGEVYRVAGVAEDITKRKQLEAELRQTRDFLQTVIDHLPVAVFVKDGRAEHFGEMLLWNQASEQMFGLMAEQVIGKTVHDYFPKEQADFFEKKDREAFKRGLLEDIPEEPIDSYSLGHRLLHTVKVPLYDDCQQPQYLLCFSEDITVRKQAEEALRESERRLATLIDNLPGYVYRVANDPNYTPEFISEGVFAITGYHQEEYLTDRSISCGQEIHPEDAEAIWKIVQDAVAAHQPYECEYRIITKSGGQKSVLERGRGVYSVEGELICLEGFVTDLSHYKQAEAALQQSEEHYRQLAEDTPALICQFLPDSTLTYVNSTYCQYFSQRPEQLLGRRFLEFLPSDAERQAVQSNYLSLTPDAPSVMYEHPVTRPDGSAGWQRWVDRAFFDEQGQLTRIQSIGFDMTEAKHAEVKLQVQQSRLNLALEAAQMGIWERDIETGEEIWSSQEESLWGFEAGTFDGKLDSFLNRVHPDDLESFQQAEEEAIQTGSLQTEFRISLPDQTTQWIYCLGKVFYNEVGLPCRIVGVDLDITERKQTEAALRESEERLRLALMAANQGIYDLNVQTGEAIVSPEYVLMLGYDPATFQETNARWIERLHPDDHESVVQTYQAYITGEIPEYKVEFRQRTQTGGWKWILSLGRIVEWDSSGQPLRMLGTHTDIGDRKQSEALLQARAQQQSAVAHLGQLALAATDLLELMDAATALVAESLAVEYCKVLELLPDGTGLLLRAGVGWQPGLVGEATVGIDQDSQAGYTLSIDQPVVVEELQTDPRFRGPALLRDHQVVSGLSVIIQGGDRPFGVLGAHSTHHRHFSQDDVNFLQAVANILATAIARTHAEAERKQAEIALRESEANFRCLATNIPGMVFQNHTTVEGGFAVLYASSGCSELYEVSAEEMLSGRYTFRDFEHPDDRPVIDQKIVETSQSLQPFNQEFRIVTLSGVLKWVHVISQPTLQADGSIVWDGIVQDISDRKQAELGLQSERIRLQLALDAAQMGTWSCNLQAGRLTWSDRTQEIFGFVPGTFAGDRDAFLAQVYLEDLDRVTRAIAHCVETGNPYNIEYRIHRLDGEVRWLEVWGIIAPEHLTTDQQLIGVVSDITNRKQAEIALQESETRFRQLAENIPEVFWVADSDLSQILYVSPAYESIWGCTCASLYENSLSFTDPIHPEDRDRILSVVQQQRHQGWNEEYRIIQPSGTVRWIWEQSFPILEHDGQVQRLVGICQDITDRKQAEESLRQLGIAVENAMTGISQLDSTGHFIMASDGYAQMLGYQPEELIGLSWADTVPEQDHQLGIAAAQKMLQQGRAEQELQAIRKDGSIFYKQILLVKSFNSRGAHDGHYCFMRDISERKQAELEIRQLNQVLEQQNRSLEALVEQRTAELLTFINALPDYIFVVERDGQRIPFCNDRLASVTPLGDRHAVQGRTLFDCFPPEKAAYFAEQNRQVFESGEMLHIQESVSLPTGQLHVDTYKIPLKHPTGEVYALIASSRDVTELVQAREELTERTIQLEAINQELESFSYSVSHDLRAPLRHINGFVNALKLRLEGHQALTDPKLVHYLEVIETSSKKMAQLIDGLLTLSRVGRKTMDCKPVNLRELTDQAISLAQTSIETTKPVEFVIGELPTVRGDASLLQQVLSNLIENAVKFTRHQPAPRIEVSSLPDGTIVVKDNGVGFQVDYGDKLFEAFQRLHTQTEFEGTGMGLAIVKRIIHRHGGTIWAESQPNQGASFYFTVGKLA